MPLPDGAVISACLSFCIARYLARGVVERRLLDNPRFRAIDKAVGEQGLRVVLLLRLSPVFPFFVMNYALGLTRVRFRDYAIGLIGMVPATAFYVYYGTVAGDLAAVLSGTARGGTTARMALLVVGAVATVAVSILIARAANRALTDVATRSTSQPTQRTSRRRSSVGTGALHATSSRRVPAGRAPAPS